MKRSLANSLIFFVILSLFHQKLNSEILPFNDKYYSFTAKFSYFEDERSNFEPDIVSDFWIPQNKKHQAIFQSRVDFSLDLFLSSHFSFSFKLPLILKRSRIIFDDFALSDQKKNPWA